METNVGLGRIVTFGKRIRSAAINLMFSNRVLGIRRWVSEMRRKLSGRPHVVSVFVELDDPYSYLLCSYLREFREYYAVDLLLYLTEALTAAYRPAPRLYPEYALEDCRRLASELGIPFLDRGETPPVECRRALLATLATRPQSADFDEELVAAICAYWRGDAESVARRTDIATDFDAAEKILAANQQRLVNLGHYNTATLHYGGEWYWGVDRLHYLIDRLDALGVRKEQGIAPRIASIRQVMQAHLPVKPPAAGGKLPAIEVFHSFRSPYAYILLTRIFNIADAFGVPCKIRPVLPMVMRGMQVPRAKLKYIMADASREARRYGIPFGNMADPVGVGVERLMAAFHYAATQNRERDLVVQAGLATWHRGIDVATDDGLRKVTAKAGLFWPDVLAAIAADEWREGVEANRAALMRAGSWGVPSVRVGDWVCWGQDRDWLVARHLEELCDSGDGILI